MNIRAFNGIVPRLGANAYVDADALVIGDVELGEDASIWPGAVLRGDVQRIRVRSFCSRASAQGRGRCA